MNVIDVSTTTVKLDGPTAGKLVVARIACGQRMIIAIANVGYVLTNWSIKGAIKSLNDRVVYRRQIAWRLAAIA